MSHRGGKSSEAEAEVNVKRDFSRRGNKTTASLISQDALCYGRALCDPDACVCVFVCVPQVWKSKAV